MEVIEMFLEIFQWIAILFLLWRIDRVCGGPHDTDGERFQRRRNDGAFVPQCKEHDHE